MTQVQDVKDMKPQLDKFGRAYGTGRRKNAKARVWIKPGKGAFIVNGKVVEQYFARPVSRDIINQAFDATNTHREFDVMCTVSGGGLSGQAGAVRHGLSRALASYNPTAYRALLRAAGLLTRDSRVVERKHYGKKKARRSFQFSKR